MEEEFHLVAFLFGREGFRLIKEAMSMEFLAFGGAFPILIAFVTINKAYFSSVKNGFVYCVAIYAASVIAGVLISETGIVDGHYESAFIAGIIAPIFFSILATVRFRLRRRQEERQQKVEQVDFSDHLIQK
jgi:hypothetical protein